MQPYGFGDINLGLVALVIAGLAAAVLGFLWLRGRGRAGTRVRLLVLTNDGHVETPRYDECDGTARDDEANASYFLSIEAYRRCKSGGPVAQLCYEWSAVPAYPGQEEKYRKARADVYAAALAVMAERAADNALEDVSREENREARRRIYQHAITATVILVLVVLITYFIVSGRVGNPFAG